jgi:hypothetical protein
MTLAAILGALLFHLAPAHVAYCDPDGVEFIATEEGADAGIVCEATGIYYPEGNYALRRDADDGDINEVTVWR